MTLHSKKVISRFLFLRFCQLFLLLTASQPLLPDTFSHFKNHWVQSGSYNLRHPFLPLVGLRQPEEDEQPAATGNDSAKVRIDDRSAHWPGALLDIDNGYWVILIITTDESGKPITIYRINTGIHYLNSSLSAVLDNSDLLNSSPTATQSRHRQNILNGLDKLVPPGQKTADLQPELYDLPKTIPTGSGFHFTPVETTHETGETETAETEATPTEPTACNEGASTSSETTRHDKETTRTQLLCLVEVLKNTHYTGFITDQLNSPHEFQCLFQVLPGSFIDLLNNDFDTLLTLPNKYLIQFLRMALMLAHDNNENSSAEGLTYYFDTLLQIFHGDTFTPIKGRLYVMSRDRLFEKLLNLRQITWQNIREPDPELQAVGWNEKAATSAEVIGTIASIFGYQCPFSQDDNNKPETRKSRLAPTRDILEPAWKKHKVDKDSEYICISLDQYELVVQEQSLSKLSSLNSGFYSSEETLLHVDRSSSNAIYSVHIGAGIVFNFTSTEQLFAYYQKNYYLFVLIHRLAYSPEYFQPFVLSRELSEEILSSTETQALNLLGLNLDQLMQPDAIYLITTRYRKEALRYHPDKGGTNKAFQDLKNAKDTLLTLVIIYGKKAE